jgi:hypothetical protein
MTQGQASRQTTGRFDDWPAVLDTHGVEFVILDKLRDGKLLQAIRSTPGWTVDFEDREAVLFSRVRAPDGAQATA